MGNYQKKEDGVFVILDSEGEVALFETEEVARTAAKNNTHCIHFGYEIFERGTGWS